jgi:hypothetical protein
VWAASLLREAFSARLRQLRAGERNIGESLADDALQGQREAESVIAAAIVEAEGLLVKVAEQWNGSTDT